MEPERLVCDERECIKVPSCPEGVQRAGEARKGEDRDHPEDGLGIWANPEATTYVDGR